MLSRDLPREDASVVPVAVHAARIARDPVLAKTGRRLMDRAAEVHAGDRRALPERGQRGKLVAADGRDAEFWQIQDRAREARRRDDVVDLEDELGGALRLARVNAEDVAGPFDPLDRRIEDDHSAREDVV